MTSDIISTELPTNTLLSGQHLPAEVTQSRRTRLGGISPTYIAVELRRQFRHIETLAFTIGLPVAMYLVFGSTFAAGADSPAGAANVHFYVMSSMALYGAVTATVTVSGAAALEIMQGWGRQIGLTPLRSSSYVAMKTIVALIFSAISVAAVFITGYFTGAETTGTHVWITTFLLCWLGSTVFALYGLAIAQWARSESAVSIASGALVLLSFFGNLFVPLSGTMLSIARFTPLYGLTGLSRWPQLQGANVATNAPNEFGPTDSLWSLILNVVVWAAIFAGLAAWATKRSRQRQ